MDVNLLDSLERKNSLFVALYAKTYGELKVITSSTHI